MPLDQPNPSHRSRHFFTFADPASPGRVTVKARKLGPRTSSFYDTVISPDSERDLLVSDAGGVKNILPRDHRRDPREHKRNINLDDRMLAYLLIIEKLQRSTSKDGLACYWTPKCLGLLRRFYENGRINPTDGHWGKPAWIYVDGRPHLLLAEGFYALIGSLQQRHWEFETCLGSNGGRSPLFCVSEQPLDSELVVSLSPLNDIIPLSFEECERIFVLPMNESDAEKAKKREKAEKFQNDLKVRKERLHLWKHGDKNVAEELKAIANKHLGEGNRGDVFSHAPSLRGPLNSHPLQTTSDFTAQMQLPTAMEVADIIALLPPTAENLETLQKSVESFRKRVFKRK